MNYSWLRDEDETQLRRQLRDLFDRGVDFVLVDHVGQAMEAASDLDIPPVAPHWNGTSPFSCTGP